jgi:hypothetical protein
VKKLVDETRANELIVVTDTYEHQDRLESYRRLAAIAATIETAAVPTLA